MNTYFSIKNEHRIESANYITLVHPQVHPDRVMNVHDFLYIIDGTWEIIEDETVYKLCTDDLLFLAAGKHHYGLKPSSPNNRHMYIHVYCEETAALSGPLWESESLIHCQDNPQVKQLFEEIISTSWTPHPLKNEKLSFLFSLLLCALTRQTERLPKDGRDSRHYLIQQIAYQLQSNPQRLFSCKEMADQFFICERTLSNLFKKSFGKSFYAFQMDMKLETIQQYLMNHPAAQLNEVAVNFGFCDEFHLGKSYKKRYGISPKRHVNQMREAPKAFL